MIPIRNMYSTYGVKDYYENHSNEYSNPHEKYIQTLLEQVNIKGDVLDLSCGDGAASLAISDCKVIGCDPYLYEQYELRTGNPCLRFSFDDIINGALQDMKFNSIICSFALHLCEKSKLNTLLYQLSRISNELIIITPHKRPEVNSSFWKLNSIIKENKVTLKKYESLYNS